MLDQKEIHNRWHSMSIAFPVNVAEATLTQQASDFVMQLHEHRHNLQEGLFRKIKISQTCL
jgi:hypothetical protein